MKRKNNSYKENYPIGYTSSNETEDFSLLANIFAGMDNGNILTVGPVQGFEAAACSQGRAEKIVFLDINKDTLLSAIMFKAFLKVINVDPDWAYQLLTGKSDDLGNTLFRASLWDLITEKEKELFDNDPRNITSHLIRILTNNFKAEFNKRNSYLKDPEKFNVLLNYINNDSFVFVQGSVSDVDLKHLSDGDFSVLYFSNLFEWGINNRQKDQILKFINQLPSTQNCRLILSRSIKKLPPIRSNTEPKQIKGKIWEYYIYR